MPNPPISIAFDLGDGLRVSPPIWPDYSLQVEPGDLSQFAPNGNGVYGYQGRDRTNPITSAPQQEARGGVIYFGNEITKEDFLALMRILGVQRNPGANSSKTFAVFTAESAEPSKYWYLAQVRIVSKFALRHMFGALTQADYDHFPEQALTIAEALWTFIETERKRWGTSWMEDRGLGGTFGGDGHFACEQLAFGLMVENDYHGIYRIWSRAWLVTK